MSSRYVTEPDDPRYWTGRLSMALTMALERPHPVARETLDAFLKHGKPSTELRDMIRTEMKESRAS